MSDFEDLFGPGATPLADDEDPNEDFATPTPQTTTPTPRPTRNTNTSPELDDDDLFGGPAPTNQNTANDNDDDALLLEDEASMGDIFRNFFHSFGLIWSAILGYFKNGIGNSGSFQAFWIGPVDENDNPISKGARDHLKEKLPKLIMHSVMTFIFVAILWALSGNNGNQVIGWMMGIFYLIRNWEKLLKGIIFGSILIVVSYIFANSYTGFIFTATIFLIIAEPLYWLEEIWMKEQKKEKKTVFVPVANFYPWYMTWICTFMLFLNIFLLFGSFVPGLGDGGATSFETMDEFVIEDEFEINAPTGDQRLRWLPSLLRDPVLGVIDSSLNIVKWIIVILFLSLRSAPGEIINLFRGKQVSKTDAAEGLIIVEIIRNLFKKKTK